MSKTFKIVLILLVCASIASAVLAVFAFMGKEREYVKRLLLEDKLAATLKDKRRLEKELDSDKKAKEKAEAKVAKIEQKIEKLNSQVEEAKEKYKVVSQDLTIKEKEILELKEDLEKERKEKLIISKKLEDVEFSYEKVKLDLSKLKDEKTKLKRKIADLETDTVELDTIVVGPSTSDLSRESAHTTRSLLKGRVLVVNRDYSFVVTDLGEEDGVKNGMIFEIREGSKFLGKAEIDKIYDTMSSASVLPGANINNIKKGNLVIESR